MSSSEISMLAHGLLAAQRIFEEKTASSVEEWAQLRVLHLDLTPSDSNRDFTFVDIIEDDKVLIFESQDWEETWRYGGHENHFGRMLAIPFEFFDNPQPFRDVANKAVEARKAREERATAKAKAEHIENLKRQLANAQKEG